MCFAALGATTCVAMHLRTQLQIIRIHTAYCMRVTYVVMYTDWILSFAKTHYAQNVTGENFTVVLCTRSIRNSTHLRRQYSA